MQKDFLSAELSQLHWHWCRFCWCCWWCFCWYLLSLCFCWYLLFLCFRWYLVCCVGGSVSVGICSPGVVGGVSVGFCSPGVCGVRHWWHSDTDTGVCGVFGVGGVSVGVCSAGVRHWCEDPLTPLLGPWCHSDTTPLFARFYPLFVPPPSTFESYFGWILVLAFILCFLFISFLFV